MCEGLMLAACWTQEGAAVKTTIFAARPLGNRGSTRFKRWKLCNHPIHNASSVTRPTIGSFSDEQFERLLAGLDQNTDSEPFENFFGNLEDMPDIAAFSSFCDPTLVPMISDHPESLLSFPPLPPIEEEVSSPNTPPVQPSDESPSAHSIPTSAPEINEALETAHWAKFLVESQRSQQEAMKVE